MNPRIASGWFLPGCSFTVYFVRECDGSMVRMRSCWCIWSSTVFREPKLKAGLNILKRHERYFAGKSSPGIFTPANKGAEVPFIIKPDLNLDVRFGSQLGDLKRSIQARKLYVDLTEMMKLWQSFQRIEEKRSRIEAARKKNKISAKDLHKNKNLADSKEVQEQREEGKRLRECFKNLNTELNDVQDKLYPLALSLPNQLHPDVALGSQNRIIAESVEGSSDVNFMKSAKRDESISKDDRMMIQAGTCYLHGDLCHIEQRILDVAEEHLTLMGFTPLSCPDMVKQYALDALGQDYRDRGEAFFVDTKESEMCLTGLSPLNFYAYYMMSVLEAKDLPERCFSIGRSYNAANYVHEEFQGLHQHFQGNQVQFLCLLENSYQEEEALFSSLLNSLQKFYQTIGVAFRVIETASENLLPSVYRRNAIEVWLPDIQNFVEVGHLTSCCDFVSRRLMIRYPANPKQTAVESRLRKYPYSIHGTVVNCNVLLDHLLHR